MSKERQDFIKKYANDVVAATRNTGLFPSVKMAQLIIESADSKGVSGKGITFVKANNGFGIKADKSWEGQKMPFNTPNDATKINYFRVYPSIKDSIMDHTNFLLSNNRYKLNGVFNAKTPQEQTRALQLSRYAENPNYANGLNAMIKAYDLERLDKGTSSTDYSGLIFTTLGIIFFLYLTNEQKTNS